MHQDVAVDLRGKRALVTGVSRGIGRAIALGLANAGADIVGVSRSGVDDELASELKAAGVSVESHAVDFSNRAAVEEFSKSLSGSDAVDILVNNAGTIKRKPAVEHPIEWWDEVIEVNLSAQFILSQAIGRRMVENGAGKIIFIASLLSFQGGITVPGYTASKSGVLGLTRALANEWAGSGVNVNAIAPGYIETDNTAALRADEVRNRQITERIPAGRWGTPDDLVGPTLFLASSMSDYVHGTVLAVDGGWLSR